MYLQSRSDTRAEISESQFRDYPSREPFTNMTRKNMFSGPIFRMRTGHTRSLAHLHNLEITEEANCRLCSEQFRETVEHQLLHCTRLSGELQELRRWIASLSPRGGLLYALWKNARKLEGFVVKALDAGAHL